MLDFNRLFFKKQTKHSKLALTRNKLFARVNSQNLLRLTEKFCFFMTEKIPINLKGDDSCGLEGIKGRPIDCKNNPWKYPENYRPNLCRQCPTSKNISKTAESPLSTVYIKFKQTEQQNRFQT